MGAGHGCSPKRAGRKNLWNPTILGVLIVLSAVGLFCGSSYLLLGTNLGARLGFLVAGACLTGFLVLLSTLWFTTATPLDQPEGPAAGLEGDRGRRQSRGVEDLRRSTTSPTDGTPVDAEGLAQLRPPSTPRS